MNETVEARIAAATEREEQQRQIDAKRRLMEVATQALDEARDLHTNHRQLIETARRAVGHSISANDCDPGYVTSALTVLLQFVAERSESLPPEFVVLLENIRGADKMIESKLRRGKSAEVGVADALSGL